ncbi:MAG: Abi-alpha family protein [Hyphomicrobium sp.]
MAKSSRSRSPVRVDVSAKAEAKLHIKGEVPSSSLGRAVDALTDIIRPFSEARGLKADILRMQREEVAIEIAKRARQKVEIERLEIQSVPNKIIVPLLEKGSCEELADDQMIERWANLLAAASMRVAVEPRFVSILSELSGKQAELLDSIAFHGASNLNYPARYLADASIELSATSMKRSLNRFLATEIVSLESIESAFDRIKVGLSRPGALLWFATITDFSNPDDYLQADYTDFLQFCDQMEKHASILESLGLISLAAFDKEMELPGGHFVEVHLQYYHLSELGYCFIEACSRPRVRQLEKIDEQSRVENANPVEFFYD